MNKNIWFILFAVLFFISCKQHIIDPSEEYHLPERVVPLKTLPGDQATLYFTSGSLMGLNSDLNLYTIENGFDSIQLRIWFRNKDNLSDSAFHLMLFKKAKNKNWTAFLVDLEYPIRGGIPDVDTLPKIKYASISFKHELLNFLDSSIYSLLENGGLSIDCDMAHDEGISFNEIIVELALERKYYLGQFPVPSDIRNECGQVERKALIELLSLLENEYRFKFLKDYLK